VALFLRKQGYEAFALRGGYQAWKEAGYPVQPKEAELDSPPEGICPDCQKPIAEHAS